MMDKKRQNRERCPPQHKYSPQEIVRELQGYELIKDIRTLRKLDRVRYLRKDTGELKKGGLVITGSLKNNYVVLKGFARNYYKGCKPIYFSLQLSEIILFKKIE